MKYKIVTIEQSDLDLAQELLMEEVNYLLSRGWQLQGGVSISCHVLYDNEHYNLAQALVRSEDKISKNNDVQVTLL